MLQDTAEKYIYDNIEKPWWANYYKNKNYEIRSLKDQRENILKQIKNYCIIQ